MLNGRSARRLAAGLVLATVLYLGPAVVRAQSCPPSPCADADSCKRAADWVVEGVVLEYVEGGYTQSCHIVLFSLGERCRFDPLPPSILVGGATQVRGRSDLVVQGLATLPRQAACFTGPLGQVAAGRSPYPDSGIVGQRYRFYGNDARPGSPAQGFVIAEPVGVTSPLP